jgi:hypothetical protein
MPSLTARLHAVEMVMEILIADRASTYEEATDWINKRRTVALMILSDSETEANSTALKAGIVQIHEAVESIFDGADILLAGIRVSEPG